MTTQRSKGGKTNGVPVPQLTSLRKQAGISQRTLAERARLCVQTISRLEQGANARYDTIELLAQALQVTPARLTKHSPRRSLGAGSISPES